MGKFLTVVVTLVLSLLFFWAVAWLVCFFTFLLSILIFIATILAGASIGLETLAAFPFSENFIVAFQLFAPLFAVFLTRLISKKIIPLIEKRNLPIWRPKSLFDLAVGLFLVLFIVGVFSLVWQGIW